jgi:predicted amidohydrolase/GT2 family glycosyltransferase
MTEVARNRIRVAGIATPRKVRGSVASIDANVAAAVETATRLSGAGVDLVCLPEGFLYAGLASRRPADVAVAPESDVVRTFAELARERRIYVAVPVLERGATGAVNNTVVLFGRDGSRLGSYAKRILWPSDSGFSELEHGVEPGAGGGPFATEFGPIGIQTCLEVHWPSGWQELGRRGAKLVLFPSEQAGGALLRHRAWDARSFVVSAVAKGGPSHAIDPLGNVIAEWTPATEAPLADLHLDFELVHLDFNERELHRLRRTLRGRMSFRFLEAERLCVVVGVDPRLRVHDVLAEQRIPTLDDYLRRIAARNAAANSSLVSLDPGAGDARVHEPQARSVSVIVPTTGHSPSLARCLQSLAEQECGVPLEIVVVANGPRAADVDCRVPGVKVVCEPKPGPAAARNRGVRESSGEYVAFIDDDCTAAPQWLQSALTTLSRAGRPAIVAGTITRSGARATWVSLFDSVSYLQQESYVRYSGACVSANVVMNRSSFERLGPFDESFREAACEDWEWSTRAGRHSIPIVFDAAAVVDHPCMERLGQLKRKAERLARGELLLSKKRGRPAAPPTLRSQVRRHIGRARRMRYMGIADRFRVGCIGVPVAYWTWRATRREDARRTASAGAAVSAR